MQTAQKTVQLPDVQQFLASADPALLDKRCDRPRSLLDKIYCAALLRTLESCQRRFGPFTLRCCDNGATACSTDLAVILHGRCGACHSAPVL